MIFKSLWRKNSRQQHPLVKSIMWARISYVYCGLISETFIFIFFNTHTNNILSKYMLLTYYGSPVCAKECNFTCAINMFTRNWKEHKCQAMSEHLKDHKYTLDPRGLNLLVLGKVQLEQMFYTIIAVLVRAHFPVHSASGSFSRSQT